MKKNLLRNAFTALAAVALTATTFVACSSDDDSKTESADKAALQALATESEALAGSATTAEYPQAAIDAFNAVITAAKAVLADESATQTVVDNILTQLTQAKATFEGSKYETIPTANLLIGLNFDEGTAATTQLTAAGKNLVATLAAGPSQIFGANTGMPTFVDGKKGKAIHFAQGSHLEITTYSAADFEGAEIAVAAWLKPGATKAGNYFFSYNDWHSWKFQIQDGNKPFFTVNTSAGVTDADDEGNGIPNDEWTHVVASLNLTAGILDFYTNGVLIKRWTTETKPNLSGTLSPNSDSWPIIIGAFANYEQALADWDGWANSTPEAWNNFEGAIDELKVYNKALTEGQVSGLYSSEK
jgi:hypothetical protein